MLLLLIHLFGIALAAFGLGMWLRRMLPAKRERMFNRWKRLLAYFQRNVQELVGIPVALVVFVVSGWCIRWFDPTSAPFDLGVLQSAAVAIFLSIVGNSIARFGVRMNIDWFYKGQEQTPYDRQWLFVIYLLAFCWLAHI